MLEQGNGVDKRRIVGDIHKNARYGFLEITRSPHSQQPLLLLVILFVALHHGGPAVMCLGMEMMGALVSKLF